MKKFITGIFHSLFKVRIFENLFHPLVNEKYTNSFLVKFIPPNYSYKKGTYRVVKKGKLVLHADLFDYNDWKAFWGLKEIERENLYRLSEKISVAVDVGSNNGWVLMNLASIVAGNNGFVFGFEPHPETYKRCMKNLADSEIKNCRVFNMGCGDHDGELMMIEEKQSNSGQNRIINDVKTAAKSNLIKVELTTLDERLADAGKVDLIKIDVEGFELNVLKGGAGILEQYRPVLFIEIDDKLLKANNTTPAELLSFLQNKYQYIFTNAFSGNKVTVTDDFSGCHLDVICRFNKN